MRSVHLQETLCVKPVTLGSTRTLTPFLAQSARCRLRVPEDSTHYVPQQLQATPSVRPVPLANSNLRPIFSGTSALLVALVALGNTHRLIAPRQKTVSAAPVKMDFFRLAIVALT